MPAMMDDIRITYFPSGFCNILQYSLLRVRVVVDLPTDQRGNCRVVIRTNLNQARRIRRQIIDQVELHQSYSTDFYDIPTRFNSQSGQFEADILLHDVGYYEFKVRAESTQSEHPWVKWADGSNVGVSVTPLPYGRDNSIYCAFIRQFGPDKHKASLNDPDLEKTVAQLQERGATVIPPTGNFQQFMEQLPFIIQKMGMKIIHLLPINPVPTSYGRMGLYGSPYATTDYFGIDHSYATFSQNRTIEDQFIDLTSTIHGLGAKVFLDMVINHSGWAASIHFTHPHWKVVDAKGRIVSPGAWGVTWEDLVELDYRHRDLWQYMADVFLCWCRRGIDGFRLDAGYMVPLEVWRYIISKVREEFPNTLFLLEGLGGPWATTEQLLTEGQMNWAYSELFQNYSRQQITDYVRYAESISATKGVLVHYAETHDNDRLAKKGKTYALIRLYVSAFTSFSGAWGFTNGVEWLATEKIDVHRNTGLNWGSKDNLVDEITHINHILADNPAFWERDNVVFLETGNEDLLAFYRSNPAGDNVALCLINLNCEMEKYVRLSLHQGSLGQLLKAHQPWLDLLNEVRAPYEGAANWEGTLGPGQCLLYRLNQPEGVYKSSVPALYEADYDKITLTYQILLERFAAYEVSQVCQETLLREVQDFRKFIALVRRHSIAELKALQIGPALATVSRDQIETHSAVWTLRDTHRVFTIPADKWLVAHTFVPCTAYLESDRPTRSMESIPSPDGLGHFSFFPPLPENTQARLRFNWKLDRDNRIERQWQKQTYPILSIPAKRKARRPQKVYPITADPAELIETRSRVFLSNGAGNLAQIPALPGRLDSKYDSLLSIAPDPNRPAQRISLAKTIRETMQIDQRFFDLDESFFRRFTRHPQPTWEFVYDDGEHLVRIQRSMVMPAGRDSLNIRYKVVDANTPVTLYAKIYTECRAVHDAMTATAETEGRYVTATQPLEKGTGVRFAPDEAMPLTAAAREGEFLFQPNWTYDSRLGEDAERGLHPVGNLFSPGVFAVTLRKGQSQIISLNAGSEPPGRVTFLPIEARHQQRQKDLLASLPAEQSRRDTHVRLLMEALETFLIQVDDQWRFMAGLPWLGQQTNNLLRCVPAFMAIGQEAVVRDLLGQVGASVRDGLPADWLDADRSTYSHTETPLRWLIGVAQLARQTGEGFLDTAFSGKRAPREIAQEIWQGLIEPTDEARPRVDPESGLLYSPPGWSWMDTREPMATPRGGYPVEAQALWHQALSAVATVLPEAAGQAGRWREQFDSHFLNLFWNDQNEYLSDVLTLKAFAPAATAERDMAIRINQLAAVQAGLVTGERARRVLAMAAGKLLVPAGLRSLAEDALGMPLELEKPWRSLLEDPFMAYQGQCIGDETHRRLAYHNGTAWVWAYAAFIEAHAIAYDYSDSGVAEALGYFQPVWSLMRRGGIGTLPEMLDGNIPHHPRGCFAFAPSVAETLRVYLTLKYPHAHRPTPNPSAHTQTQTSESSL